MAIANATESVRGTLISQVFQIGHTVSQNEKTLLNEANAVAERVLANLKGEIWRRKPQMKVGDVAKMHVSFTSLSLKRIYISVCCLREVNNILLWRKWNY